MILELFFLTRNKWNNDYTVFEYSSLNTNKQNQFTKKKSKKKNLLVLVNAVSVYHHNNNTQQNCIYFLAALLRKAS